MTTSINNKEQVTDSFNSLLLLKRKRGKKDIEEIDTDNIIFNDKFYIDAQDKYIKDSITKVEIALHKSKKIRKVYKSFEHLLIDNVTYYSRIIRTIYFLFENRGVQDGKSHGYVENPFRGLSRALYKQKITPTQLYYIALLPPDFTFSEFMYAFPDVIHGIPDSNELTSAHRGVMFQALSNHARFKILHELARITTQSSISDSYSKILNADKTPYRFLKTIMPYKYQKSINIDIQGKHEESLIISESYGKFLSVLKRLSKSMPDEYTSLRLESVQMHNMSNPYYAYYMLEESENHLCSTGSISMDIVKSCENDKQFINEFQFDSTFLELALLELLSESKENVDKFYGIKLFTHGGVSSIRLKRSRGGIQIKETTFDKKGNVIMERVSATLKSLRKTARIVINQFRYFVFDIDKANVINTNLLDVGDVMNHITEVVVRHQKDSTDLSDKYDKEVERVMKQYVDHIKEQRKLK